MKRGFTLAEALITLAVIGVVAVLTVPNVLQNYQRKVWVTQLKKAYNQFTNNAKQYMVDNEVSLLNEGGKFSVTKFLSEYFNVVGKCENSNIDECLAKSYKSLDGETTHMTSQFMREAKSSAGQYDENPDALNELLDKTDNQFTCAKLDTGATVCMTPIPPVYNCVQGTKSCDHAYSVILLDVNGKLGPNIKGRDFFSFHLYSDGKVGNNHTIFENTRDIASQCGSTKAGYADSCFTKIIKDGWKMDY